MDQHKYKDSKCRSTFFAAAKRWLQKNNGNYCRTHVHGTRL